MESIEAHRRAVYDLVAKKLGKDARQPRQFTLQAKAAEAMSVIMALPVDVDSYSPLQDSLTGELFFNMGNSALGGSSPLGG